MYICKLNARQACLKPFPNFYTSPLKDYNGQWVTSNYWIKSEKLHFGQIKVMNINKIANFLTLKREFMPWLIHVDVWQGPPQCGEVIVLQLKQIHICF